MESEGSPAGSHRPGLPSPLRDSCAIPTRFLARVLALVRTDPRWCHVHFFLSPLLYRPGARAVPGGAVRPAAGAISLGGPIVASFPQHLKAEQRIDDALAELLS
ncbi:predicted protein [Streptomyces filamentosus NRRL 15998]|uniref:Predicted protein n=1 Tax=Streptomyces filamentosus NRRL 15998 TaxID=457431 RepID=D6AKN7_STRFL|nr:predicted protein [Streptomyces filamentosus NRRL 15998]